MTSFVIVTALLLTAAGDPATVTVNIPADKGYVQVEAEYVAEQPFLEMYEGAYSDGVAGGLAGFVEDLSVARADGAPVHVDAPQEGRWRIDAPAGEPITVRYTVRLDHEKHKWPFGVDEIAYTRDDGVSFISRTILIVNDGVRAARVRFVVPEGWRVAAPWKPVDGEPFTFDVANRRILTESCIIAGDFIQREVRAGDTVVTLAMGHALEPYVGTLESALQAIVPAFRDLFQDSPQARFLAVVNAHTSGGITDGSAYPNSVSMLTPKRMEGVNYDQAVYTIAHEVLHLWNGFRMRPVAQTEWFREGFTDYLTWRTLAKLRLVSEAALLRELRRQTAAYVNQDRNVSLAAAGEEKAANAVLVYEGGSLAALCLDATIRARTENARDITHYMNQVYARSALQNAPYDASTLTAVASELAGQDMQSFFDRYVSGMEPLPLAECMVKLGLRIEQKATGDRISVTIAPDESAAGAAAAARDAFLGR